MTSSFTREDKDKLARKRAVNPALSGAAAAAAGGALVANVGGIAMRNASQRKVFNPKTNEYSWVNRSNVTRLLNSLGLEIVSHSTEYQYTCLEEVASMTGRRGVQTLARTLGIQRSMLRLPIVGSYLLLARKRPHPSRRP